MSLTAREMYPDLDSVFAAVRMYAGTQQLTPVQVAELFNAGLAAGRAFGLHESGEPNAPAVAPARGEFAP